jgi:excisionase family DNA binding protein
MSTQPNSTDLAALIERLELREPAYSRLEAAKIIGVSESGIDRLIANGELPAFSPSKRVVTITRQDLARFMWARERSRQPDRPKPPDKSIPRSESHRHGRARTLPRVKVAS